MSSIALSPSIAFSLFQLYLFSLLPLSPPVPISLSHSRLFLSETNFLSLARACSLSLFVSFPPHSHAHRMLIEATDLKKTIFRSDHASNYLPLKGVLGKDKTRLLCEVFFCCLCLATFLKSKNTRPQPWCRTWMA